MTAAPQFAVGQEKLPQSVAVADTEPGLPECVQFVHKTIFLAVMLTLPAFCSS